MKIISFSIMLVLSCLYSFSAFACSTDQAGVKWLACLMNLGKNSNDARYVKTTIKAPVGSVEGTACTQYQTDGADVTMTNADIAGLVKGSTSPSQFTVIFSICNSAAGDSCQQVQSSTYQISYSTQSKQYTVTPSQDPSPVDFGAFEDKFPNCSVVRK